MSSTLQPSATPYKCLSTVRLAHSLQWASVRGFRAIMHCQPHRALAGATTTSHRAVMLPCLARLPARVLPPAAYRILPRQRTGSQLRAAAPVQGAQVHSAWPRRTASSRARTLPLTHAMVSQCAYVSIGHGKVGKGDTVAARRTPGRTVLSRKSTAVLPQPSLPRSGASVLVIASLQCPGALRTAATRHRSYRLSNPPQTRPEQRDRPCLCPVCVLALTEVSTSAPDSNAHHASASSSQPAVPWPKTELPKNFDFVNSEPRIYQWWGVHTLRKSS